MDPQWNPYSHPGKLGLEIVGEAWDENASYSFCYFVVWRDQEGNLYYAEDEGCSCPAPFENHQLGDLQKADVEQIHTALDAWIIRDSWRDCQIPGADLHWKLAHLEKE